jgi:threonine dehydrogenase-like Zn-dependent dehydrogenase
MGANNTFNVNYQKNYYDFIKKKYDVVIDCTGVPEVINQGFDLLEKNGHFIFFGVAPTSEKILISPYQIYENSWKITGVYPDMRSFGNIIKMIESKILDFKPLVSHRFHLNDFIEAFNFFRDLKNYRLKVIVYND